jgi:thioredoxin 1
MTVGIKDLSNESFNSFVKEGVAVVDFWAEWCGPCKMIAPIFKEAAEELGENAKFGKVDVDKNQELAQKFGVMSIPTILIFKNGEPVDRGVGVVEKEDLVKRIEGVK